MVLWFAIPVAVTAGVIIYYELNKKRLYRQVELPGSRDIRVLAIKPGNFDDYIHCQLRKVSIDSPGPDRWHALSYAWGDKPRVKKLDINTITVEYRKTLLTVIRHLRHHTEERIFWIDAICINQDSDEEKARQIPLMREIYQKAQSTYVYLGDETDTSKEIFTFLSNNQQAVLRGLDGDTISLDYLSTARIWTGILKDIFPRPWFSRLWVVQELTMSKRPIVKCGSQEVPWDVFSMAWKIALRMAVQNNTFNFYPEDPPNHWKADPNIDAPEVLDSLRSHQHVQNPGLSFWLQTFRHKGCKDPRDKVFALLGLAGDRSCPELSTLSYEKQSASEMYIAVTKYFLQGAGDLDVMLFRGNGPRRPDLPSWVPDYSQTGHVWQLSRDYFGAGDEYHADGNIMPATHGGRYQSPNPTTLRQRPVISSGNVMTVQGVLIDDIAHVDALNLEHLGNYDPPNKYFNSRHYPLGGTDYKATFTRMILFDRDRQGRRYKNWQWLGALDFPRTLNSWEKDRLPGHSFIFTERGYMGLARTDVAVGDVVCILFGCSVPVVLRKVQDETFKLVCGCYVEGIMDGQALNGTGVKSFVIV